MSNLVEKNQFDLPELQEQDLTQALYETSMKLNEANALLKEKEKNQKDIFERMSHDLRAPIVTIKGTLESLLIHNPDTFEECKPSLELMNKRVIQLENMVNKILTITKLTRNNVDINKSVINAGMYLEECFYTFEADPTYADRELILDIPIEFDYNISINPERFFSVLDNLFFNAKKFTNKGDSITLSARPDGDKLCIILTDTGLGVPEDAIDHIFELTYMVNDARTPEASSGSGLGLTIVRQIVELHGGSVRCESEYGKYTKFIILLPLVE